MGSNKPFGLIITKKAKAFQSKTSGVFGSDSDDDIPPKKKMSKIPQSKPISSIKLDESVDPSIYEYDTIYDDMKAQKVAESAPKEKKSSRYIDKLLKAADKRKKEYERRVEKKVQVEREKEGNKYEDKEMFVTSAYKKKMQEREEEEERERRENMLNDMMDVTKQNDLSGFYRHFLKQSVGEEKIPVFGENVTIKEEPHSGSDTEKVPHTDKNLPKESENLYDDKDLSDSDDSESEKSNTDNANSYEKSVREYRKRTVDESTDEDVSNSSEKLKSVARRIKKSKNSVDEKSSKDKIKDEHSQPQKKEYKKSSKRSSDEDIESTDKVSKVSEGRHKKLQKTHKSARSASHRESESAEESDLSASDTGSDYKLASRNGVKEDQIKSEMESPKEKKNIFEKRHVGELFAEAQARYFQRLAARSS